MEYIIKFFEFVLQKDNPLYKAREKRDDLYNVINKYNLSSKEKEKKVNSWKKAKTDFLKAREISVNQFIPDWIENFAKQSEITSKPFNRSTHLSKFESAANDYGSIDSKQYLSKSKNLISTSCVSNIVYDIAYSNGNQINLGKFLLVADENGETIFEKIGNDDFSWVEPFFLSKEKFQKIRSGMKSLISMSPSVPNPSQHKQVYFPVQGKIFNYHILSPLYSSSFSHFLYSRVRDKEGKHSKLRVAKQEGKYKNGVLEIFSNIGVIRMGGNKPNNISPLNSMRFGESVLLSCQPPQWIAQNIPPANRKTIFDRNLASKAINPFKQLKNLLVAMKSNELSMNLFRKKLIYTFVSEVAEQVFDYVIQVQRLKHMTGWSQKSKLPSHQKYWLDPYRQDEEFVKSRADIDWQSDISVDFAKWINRQIKHPQLTLGIVHENHWKNIFRPLVREFIATTDVTIYEHKQKGKQA